ncbi:MAG: carbonic anhydrase [Desulfobulbaceae bacterium]|uniref:Carbonic anhydrase n=1 Tax=Candidatus Desulfobia pelagia TaxID=2841692 RepID=A0A8J6NDA1_9BACT|nr:carbonic anhydrase [Candidatus Desulfobia pelagia]
MRKKIFPFSVSLLAILCSIAYADMRPQLKNRVGIPPFQILKEIIDTNYTIRHTSDHPRKQNAPHLTWLADPDPRIRSSLISSSTDIYEVRNLANQLNSSLATIDYGIHHLHTPLLLITGNNDNAAIRLFSEGYESIEQTIRLELDHLHLPLAREVGLTVKEETEQDREMRLIEANVDYQVTLASHRYSQRIKAGRLVVVGGVIDLNNHYGSGKNRMRIINVNGEKDTAKLRTLQLFRQLKPERLHSLGREKMPSPRN